MSQREEALAQSDVMNIKLLNRLSAEAATLERAATYLADTNNLGGAYAGAAEDARQLARIKRKLGEDVRAVLIERARERIKATT